MAGIEPVPWRWKRLILGSLISLKSVHTIRSLGRRVQGRTDKILGFGQKGELGTPPSFNKNKFLNTVHVYNMIVQPFSVTALSNQRQWFLAVLPLKRISEFGLQYLKL